MARKPPPQVPVRHPRTTMYFPHQHHQATIPPTTAVRNNNHSITPSIIPSTTKKKAKKTQTITHPPLPLLPHTGSHRKRKETREEKIKVVEHHLYQLFESNVDKLWYIRQDGQSCTCKNQSKLNDWRRQLDSQGSVLTIIFGISESENVHRLIDEIVVQCQLWKKVYKIVHPTPLWIDRMTVLCPSDVLLPVAMCLPRIKVEDTEKLNVVRKEINKILYYNAGDTCDYLLDPRKVEKYVVEVASYLTIETKLDKIIEVIEDDRAGLVIFEKFDILSLDERDSRLDIVSRCYENDVPYIWITCMESIANAVNVILDKEARCLCFLKLVRDDSTDQLFNETHFQSILNSISSYKNEATEIQKGRRNKWSPTNNGIDSNHSSAAQPFNVLNNSTRIDNNRTIRRKEYNTSRRSSYATVPQQFKDNQKPKRTQDECPKVHAMIIDRSDCIQPDLVSSNKHPYCFLDDHPKDRSSREKRARVDTVSEEFIPTVTKARTENPSEYIVENVVSANQGDLSVDHFEENIQVKSKSHNQHHNADHETQTMNRDVNHFGGSSEMENVHVDNIALPMTERINENICLKPAKCLADDEPCLQSMKNRNDIRNLLLTEAEYDIEAKCTSINEGRTQKRSDYLTWDDYFMAIAVLSSYRSKDPIRPTGACLVDQSNRIIGTGYNGFPIGCSDDVLPWNSNDDIRDSVPTGGKTFVGETSTDPALDGYNISTPTLSWLQTSDPYIVSAEVNAILNKCSSDCVDARLYTTHYPTNDCAKIIIQAGINEVIYLDDEKQSNSAELSIRKDPDNIRASRILFGLAGVKTRSYRPLIRSISLNLTNAASTPATEANSSVTSTTDALADSLQLITPTAHNHAEFCFCRSLLIKEAAYDPTNPPIGSIPKRRDTLTCDDYFMAISFLSAQRSKDPNTQVGACIVDPKTHKILGLGYNEFPIGCADDCLPWSRSINNPLHTKYMFVVHAEQNAILNKGSSNVFGATIYVALFPCHECAKFLIQAGIHEVVYMHDTYHNTDSCAASRILFQLSGVKLRRHTPNKSIITLNLF